MWCGGGDSLRAIADLLRTRNIEAELVGIDGRPHMVDYAKALSCDYPEIRFECADILATDFTIDPCDILLSTQFIYRFEDRRLASFLKKNKYKISEAIIFTDLQRHWLPYAAFFLMSNLLLFNYIVKNDGLMVIKRSYIRKELEEIYQAAGFKHFKLHWKWAFRYLTVVDLSQDCSDGLSSEC